MEYTDLYINGAWRPTDERIDVINPATEEVLASVASAGIEDANDALDAAEAAMADWAARTPRQRSEVLRKAWELMTARLDEFAHLITLENGKAGVDAKGEATYAAEFFRWFAEEAVRADGLITHAPASGARIVVQHKPAGLAVLVTPWNYPAAMGTRKIAPALAAGCGVIIKPASETPLTMLALMPLLKEAGVPDGLVNVLPSKQTGALVDHMLHDPRVRVVSFTGSTGTCSAGPRGPSIVMHTAALRFSAFNAARAPATPPFSFRRSLRAVDPRTLCRPRKLDAAAAIFPSREFELMIVVGCGRGQYFSTFVWSAGKRRMP